MKQRYLIISPCRDEAAYARRTLESVVSQTVLPARWIIVDDGSTDESPDILAEYEREWDFITVIRREDRGQRAVGPGVIDAFYAGYETVNPADFPYLCKMDLDLDLPPNYFESLLKRMADDPRLGTCSGKPYFHDARTGQLISEKCGDETSVGMTKFYRTECFEQIGGFARAVMWDGIDCHRCRMMGWKAASWDKPELRFVHLRPMGSSQQSMWAGRVRHGRGQYFMGTSLPYMLVSAAYRMTRPPLIVGGLAMLYGFLQSMVTRQERYDDAAFRRFLRRYQWMSLMRGKARATAIEDDRGASRWNPPTRMQTEQAVI